MKPPHLSLLYHLEADMSTDDFHVGRAFGAGQRRVIMNIIGGTVEGPGLKGTIEQLGGADWGLMVSGTDFMRLDARYTVKTDDGQYLYIRAKGIFTPRAGLKLKDIDSMDDLTQEQVEWFSHLRVEAGEGKYNWLNSVLAVGVMSMRNRKICIDAYRLTNFPDDAPPDIRAKLS